MRIAASKAQPNSDHLTREDEQTLGRRWLDGDVSALHSLIAKNIPLVAKLCRTEFRNFGIPFDDLMQQGCLGLTTAARKFQPSRGLRFSTYAVWWIRAAIYKYAEHSQGTIRLPALVRRRFFAAKRKRMELERAGTDNLADALEAASGMSDALFSHLASCLAVGVELDNHDDFGPVRLMALKDHRLSPEECVSLVEGIERRGARIRSILHTLDARERLIIESRYLKPRPRTLQQLGDRLGVSRERIRQIEELALKKLRDALGDVPVDE